jgi:hypothetical protein
MPADALPIPRPTGSGIYRTVGVGSGTARVVDAAGVALTAPVVDGVLTVELPPGAYTVTTSLTNGRQRVIDTQTITVEDYPC